MKHLPCATSVRSPDTEVYLSSVTRRHITLDSQSCIVSDQTLVVFVCDQDELGGEEACPCCCLTARYACGASRLTAF